MAATMSDAPPVSSPDSPQGATAGMPTRKVIDPAQTSATTTTTARSAEGVPYALIELFFFAYRDFVGDPDRVLADYGFGRAHHRVLHFVDRHPGLTITDLLDILKITKQSLNRVLKELVQTGFVEVRPGVQDRRQRHLHATAAGHDLAIRLASVQGVRMQRALETLAQAERGAVEAWLMALIETGEQARVRGWIERR